LGINAASELLAGQFLSPSRHFSNSISCIWFLLSWCVHQVSIIGRGVHGLTQWLATLFRTLDAVDAMLEKPGFCIISELSFLGPGF
jgi:hypothetical protein